MPTIVELIFYWRKKRSIGWRINQEEREIFQGAQETYTESADKI